MKQLKKDAERIKSLEIQGATNVCLSACDFLNSFAQRIQATNKKEILEQLYKAKDVLIDIRPTEPAMKNGLKYILKKLELEADSISLSDIPLKVQQYKEKYHKRLLNSKEKIAKIGANRIPYKDPEGFTVMTHCHSTIVSAILIEAKKQGREFKVINTETQPKLQGRKTTKELLEENIEVIHIVDSAMRWAVNHFEVDLILIGADSITSEGTVLNKIGSRLLALVAHEEHVPFYVASPLLKYNPETSFGLLEKIEMRPPNEIWENPPEGVQVINPAFETVSRRYIDGIITEAGIFAPSYIHIYFERLYPELVG